MLACLPNTKGSSSCRVEGGQISRRGRIVLRNFWTRFGRIEDVSSTAATTTYPWPIVCRTVHLAARASFN